MKLITSALLLTAAALSSPASANQCTLEALTSDRVREKIMQGNIAVGEWYANYLWKLELPDTRLSGPRMAGIRSLEYAEARRRRDYEIMLLTLLAVWEEGCSAAQLEKISKHTELYSPALVSLAYDVESRDAIRPQVQEFIDKTFGAK